MAVYKVVILEKVFDKGLQYNFSFDLQLSKMENSDANHRGLDPVQTSIIILKTEFSSIESNTLRLNIFQSCEIEYFPLTAFQPYICVDVIFSSAQVNTNQVLRNQKSRKCNMCELLSKNHIDHKSFVVV